MEKRYAYLVVVVGARDIVVDTLFNSSSAEGRNLYLGRSENGPFPNSLKDMTFHDMALGLLGLGGWVLQNSNRNPSNNLDRYYFIRALGQEPLKRVPDIKWEYLIFREGDFGSPRGVTCSDAELERELQQTDSRVDDVVIALGKQGWELVEVTVETNTRDMKRKFYFKRRVNW
jgi:hypothetical protein